MSISKLKSIRSSQHLSQDELAALSGVSIKTIQRLESGKSKGSAYTVKQIALALNIEPDQLTDSRDHHTIQTSAPEKETSVIKKINFSTLLVILIPLSNIVVPLLLLQKHKSSESIRTSVKKIVSIQIIWTMATLVFMLLVPILFATFIRDPNTAGIPLSVPAYIFAVFVNVLMIFWISYLLTNRPHPLSKLPNFL